MESFSLILGLIFVVLIAAAIAAVGAAIVFGVVRLWYLEEDFTKPKKAGVLTWVTLSAAIVAYIILFPRTETLEANQALMYARTTGDGFTVTRAEIVYDDGFAALFVEAESGEESVLRQARSWNARRFNEYAPWGDYNGARPKWAALSCSGGETFDSPGFDATRMSWCPASRKVTFFRMSEGNLGG